MLNLKKELYRTENQKHQTKFIYSKLYDFCRYHRNNGNAYQNPVGKYPKRVVYIIELLETLRIPYLIHPFGIKHWEQEVHHTTTLYNIYLPGTGETGRMLTAHHDIVNPLSDNANDNSCSVINCIAYKILNPNSWVAIFDGEEIGLYGAIECVQQIESNSGIFKNFTPHSILNLELTGVGGTNFFYGTNGSLVNEDIKNLFPDAPEITTPSNDAQIFQMANIPATVITTLPITTTPTSISNSNGYLNIELLDHCHELTDSVNAISLRDMKVFVDEVVDPLMRINS